MRVLVTGARGGIGRALVPLLAARGDEVVAFNRQQPGPLAGFDAVVHLAGESIVGRWTGKKKTRIHESRQRGTHELCETLAKQSQRPRVLVSASAVGYYGDRGDEVLTEVSAPGTSFLAQVCRDWEAATAPATDAGIRVVNLRFGLVLDGRAGALPRMVRPFRWGLGGVIGSGRQWWSWVAVDDVVGAVVHALETDSLRGPVNVVAPQPVTNWEFTRALGRALRRPTVVPLPAWVVGLVFGEMGTALFLASARVQAARLRGSGYRFRHPTLDAALSALLTKSSPPRR